MTGQRGEPLGHQTGQAGVDRFQGTEPALQAEIAKLVAEDLREVEALFRSNLESPTRIVSEIGSFIAEGGGKRIRPTMHLLLADLAGYRGPHAPLLGTVLELIHCATLIHDDVIDAAATRRGRPSAHAVWGQSVTVLFGDYMFAKAMELALRAGSLEVMQRLAQVTLSMTEGEMLQTRYLGRTELTVEQHLDLVEKKTAALFGCCGDLAGILAGLDDTRRRALHRYGLNLGMAFQIVDDLLDWTAEPESLGKPTASDLREGKVTLAVLDLLATQDKFAKEVVSRIMRSDTDEFEAIERLRGLLHERGAVGRARDRARVHAATAVKQLALFPEGAARRALAALPELLIDRDR